MYYKFLYTVVVFLVNGKNEWMKEWMDGRNGPSYNFLPYSTILSSCWFGTSNHVLCLQVPRQWCWGFSSLVIRILVISMSLAVLHGSSSTQPTEKKDTHSTLNEEKGNGLTEVKKKTSICVSRKSGFAVSPLCRKWLLFYTCSYVLKFIYEVPLTKKHDTEKRERVNKHWENFFYCTIMNFLQKAQIMFPLFLLFLTPLLQVAL